MPIAVFNCVFFNGKQQSAPKKLKLPQIRARGSEWGTEARPTLHFALRSLIEEKILGALENFIIDLGKKQDCWRKRTVERKPTFLRGSAAKMESNDTYAVDI